MAVLTQSAATPAAGARSPRGASIPAATIRRWWAMHRSSQLRSLTHDSHACGQDRSWRREAEQRQEAAGSLPDPGSGRVWYYRDPEGSTRGPFTKEVRGPPFTSVCHRPRTTIDSVRN